jgi:hypothetical protein
MDFIFLSSVNTVLSFIVMVIKLCPMDLVVQNAIQLWRNHLILKIWSIVKFKEYYWIEHCIKPGDDQIAIQHPISNAFNQNKNLIKVSYADPIWELKLDQSTTQRAKVPGNKGPHFNSVNIGNGMFWVPIFHFVTTLNDIFYFRPVFKKFIAVTYYTYAFSMGMHV